MTVFNVEVGELAHPIAGRKVTPTFLGGAAPALKSGQDYRQSVADWLVSPENPAFARNLANIVWSHFMGQGIVEPIDDARVSNPPSNPELLDALAKRLVEFKYDIKPLVREILASRTYQLSTVRNDSNPVGRADSLTRRSVACGRKCCSTVFRRRPVPATASPDWDEAAARPDSRRPRD